MPISFLIDIDLASNIFKILLDGSSGFSAPAFSTIDNLLDFQTFEIHTNNIIENTLAFFSDSLECLGLSKDKSYWFWGSGHVPKSRDHRNDCFGVLHKQTEEL